MPVILKKLGVAYFAIPKVASTSIKRALYEVDTGKPYVRPPGQKHGVHAIYPTHHTTEADWRACEGLWKFAVFRDPARRLISAHANRIMKHGDLRRTRWPDLKARLLGISMRPDLEEFLIKLNRYMMLSNSVRHHVEGYRHFVGNDLSRLDASFRQEELHLLQDALSEKLNRPIELPRFQTSNARTGIEDLSPKARDALWKFTKPDYDLLKGLYEPPF